MTAPIDKNIEAEVARIMAMTDEEIASSSPEDMGWGRGMKQGIQLGRRIALEDAARIAETKYAGAQSSGWHPAATNAGIGIAEEIRRLTK